MSPPSLDPAGSAEPESHGSTGRSPASGDGGLFDVILNQRACRQFSDESVAEGDIELMLEAATHAPSAENRQPWVFVVVCDARTRSAIDGLTRDLWNAGGRAHSEQSLRPKMFAEVDTFFGGGYGGAPVLIVVAGDGRDGSPRRLLASSLFPATQNLLLAATALGYGTSMTTLATHSPVLAELLALPEGVHPFAVVPVGRPARALGPPRRRPVHDVAHRDHFGEPWESAPDSSPGS